MTTGQQQGGKAAGGGKGDACMHLPTVEPAQLNRWDVDAGALWNGMVLPLVNMSIRGALWYQGENNVFQCQGGRDAVLGDPSACGTVRDNSGYGCFMGNLIRTWRAAFSASSPTSVPT